MTAPLVHHTLTWRTDGGGEWGWVCKDCPAKASGYRTETQAKRVAAIHEDPSRKPIRIQGGPVLAATKN